MSKPATRKPAPRAAAPTPAADLLPPSDRLGAEPALAAMRAGWIVRRVGADGAPAKFMRLAAPGGMESAANEAAVLRGQWDRASTDINSFMASTYLLVGDVRAKEYAVEYAPFEVGGIEALRAVYGVPRSPAPPSVVAVFPTAPDAARVHYMASDGALMQAEGEAALAEGAWTPSRIAVTDFMALRFRAVVSWKAVGSSVRYVPGALVGDLAARAVAADSKPRGADREAR